MFMKRVYQANSTRQALYKRWYSQANALLQETSQCTGNNLKPSLDKAVSSPYYNQGNNIYINTYIKKRDTSTFIRVYW